MRRVLLVVFAALALGSQYSSGATGSTPPRPILNTQRGPDAEEKPRRVMVARFGERVGTEGAGRAAAEIVGRVLQAEGLEVTFMDASPVGDAAVLRQARDEGADAALLGTVTQWTRRDIETHDTVVYRRRSEVFVPGKQRVESVVALTVRVLQVPSGRIAYSTLAHWSTPWEGEPEAAAEKLLQAALEGWFSAWRKR